jgi:hypothetical protein
VAQRYQKLSQQEIALAESVNILEYALTRGYPLKRTSSKEYRITGQGGLCIDSNGKKWNSFSGKGCGGVIQFVMAMENKNWLEATKILLAYCQQPHREIQMKPIKNSRGDIHDKASEDQTRSGFKLPKKNANYRHLYAYLIKTRHIDAEIVNQFVKEHKLYEDERNNCVFVGYDDNNVARYASRRGTSPHKKFCGDVLESNKSHPFCKQGASDTLLVFEAPIDLMSYMTLIKKYGIETDYHMISMGGLTYVPIVTYINAHPEIKNIRVCTDNDSPGNEFAKTLNQDFGNEYSISRHVPRGKDFNEELITFSKQQKVVNQREKIDEEVISEEEHRKCIR